MIIYAGAQIVQWCKYYLKRKSILNIIKIRISLLLLLFLLLLLKTVGNARLGEGDLHPISPMVPTSQYQPIE